MASPGRAAQVSARVGALVVHIAAARGVPAAQLMADVGFEPAWLEEAQARMPLAMEEQLWNRAAQWTDDPLFGLHAAAQIRAGAFDVLDYAVRTAPDLRTALQRLVRYNRLVHDLALFEISTHGSEVRIAHRFGKAGMRPCRQASEFTLACLLVVASQMGGHAVQALAVDFAHTAGAPVEDYASVFGVAPRFNAEVSCLVLPAELLDRSVPGADPALSRIVTAHADLLLQAHAHADADVVEQVRALLAECMADGPPTLTQVARRLHLSERSLQRRMDEGGTRFSRLVDEVRCELALRYVRDPRLALGEVAYLLGFAEVSPFHRAFRRWTGTTPAAMRRTVRP
jgi:AraC-like DNA-binding protein